MLVRQRLSRILYLRRLFNYPISLSFDTLSKLGLARVLKIGFSYLRARAVPIKPERSLEDFFIFPEAAEGIRRLHDAGFLLIVITNQPDVATGKQTRPEVGFHLSAT